MSRDTWHLTFFFLCFCPSIYIRLCWFLSVSILFCLFLSFSVRFYFFLSFSVRFCQQGCVALFSNVCLLFNKHLWSTRRPVKVFIGTRLELELPEVFIGLAIENQHKDNAFLFKAHLNISYIPQYWPTCNSFKPYSRSQPFGWSNGFAYFWPNY